ncbi:transposable element Tcb2 transposase [Trichonephila clavipes]|nr:transposable element Tcb2 transposase [Trichonephila clavipes]
MLGRRTAARQPYPTFLPELRRALLDEWCDIPQDQIDNLILSMPRRCKETDASEDGGGIATKKEWRHGEQSVQMGGRAISCRCIQEGQKKEISIASNYECPKCNERMGLYERKSAVLDGFEWRWRMGMFDHFLAEYKWRCSHCHSLSDEAFKAFLKSAVTLYPPLGKDQQ